MSKGKLLLIAAGVLGIGYVIYTSQQAAAAPVATPPPRQALPPGAILSTNATIGGWR